MLFLSKLFSVIFSPEPFIETVRKKVFQPSVRKTDGNGRKHKENVRLYYQQWMEEQAQKLVDATAKAFKEGKISQNPLASVVRPPGGAMIPPPPSLAAPSGSMMPGMPP